MACTATRPPAPSQLAPFGQAGSSGKGGGARLVARSRGAQESCAPEVGPPPGGPARVRTQIPVVFFTAKGIPGEVGDDKQPSTPSGAETHHLFDSPRANE